MTKTFLILLILSGGQILGKNTDKVRFEKIFGAHCPDSILHPTDKKKVFFLQFTEEGFYIVAYESKKMEWAVKIEDLISDDDNDVFVDVECIKFKKRDKKLVIRLFFDTYVTIGGKKIFHIDIFPESGQLVDKELAKK